MSPLFETILGPLVFVLIFQPFYLLQILPFWNFLEPDRKNSSGTAGCSCFPGCGADHGTGPVRCFSSIPRAYWACGYIIWIPQFLLSF